MRSRIWTVPVALTFAAVMASGASAQGASATTPTTATTTISERGAIEVTGDVIFQDISVNQQVSLGPVMSSSDAAANVTVIGADAVSLAVPETFDLTRQGGIETLTVVTSSNGDYTTLGQMQGLLLTTGDALSIDVGGAIRVNASQLAPGEYRGLLVVVAQFN